MTTQEAIEILKLQNKFDERYIYGKQPDVEMAIDMAIRSLEAWEKVREDIHNFNGMDTYVCGDGLYKWIKAKDIVESINKHLGEVENDSTRSN